MGDIFQSLPTLVVMPQSDIEDETPFKKTENKTMHSGLNWGVMWTFEYMVYHAFQLDFNYHIFGSIAILLHCE